MLDRGKEVSLGNSYSSSGIKASDDDDDGGTAEQLIPYSRVTIAPVSVTSFPPRVDWGWVSWDEAI